MSSSLPHISEKISKSNFPRSSREFKDLIVTYGRPASEIITGIPLLLTAPAKGDLESDGSRKYHRAQDGSLSAEGLADFNFDRTEFRAYIKDRDGLLAFMLASLSPESKVTLETKIGNNGYVVAKANQNTFRIWELVNETHLVGSGRTRQHQMLQFLSIKQTSSHEDFLSVFHQLNLLVLGHFQSAAHPGFVSWDLICRCVYLNGVDPVFFDRQISKAIEDMPLASCAEPE